MLRKLSRILFVFLALGIGLYPLVYFTGDRHFGLLSTKTDALLADIFWNTGFYTHITGGGLALLSGWVQFSAGIRAKRLALHRTLGKIYLVCCLAAGTAGVYLGFYATGGPVAALGFIALGLVWLSTTLAGYRAIRNREEERHRRWMTYSYAACFAAVTLRIWLPLLVAVFQDFNTAYRIVAWLCWAPNLAFAWYLLRKDGRRAARQSV